MFKIVWYLAILMFLIYVGSCKPYLYQAQLLKAGRPDCPAFVVLLSDRHAVPRPDWAVAVEQSEEVLATAARLNGFIVVEDGASSVMQLSSDKQNLFAKSFQSSTDLDLCCAAVSVTTEPKLHRLVDQLHDKKTSIDRTADIKNTIAADVHTHACRSRVMSQLQENSLLFLTLRAARRGIAVKNIECRHPGIDRTTWKGAREVLAQLNNNLQQIALLKECPLVGPCYKHFDGLGYRSRVFDPVDHYMRNLRIVADCDTPIMNLLRMEDQARYGINCFKDVVRSMLGFFKDYNPVYAPIVEEVSRMSLYEFYRGAQDLVFSILGSPIIDLNILKALYEHRTANVVIVCAGGCHIESIRPCLEQFGYASVVRVGSHSNQMAYPPVDMKRFFDLFPRI